MRIGASDQIFDPRLLAGVVAAGVLAFIGFMVLTAYAGNFSSGRDGRAHPLSVSAIGYKGLVDLIGLNGAKTVLARGGAVLDSEDLLVVTIDQRTKQGPLTELLDRRRSKATLLVMPKWLVQPHVFKRGWVNHVGRADPSLVEQALPDWLKIDIVHAKGPRVALTGRGFLDGVSIPIPNEAQIVTGNGLEPLLAGPGTFLTVLARVTDRGPLYILADPDLLNNQGLRDRERARAAVELIERLNSTDAESVMFDLTLSGFGDKPNLLRLAFEPPFLALTAAVLIAGLLAGLHGAASFGPSAHEGRAIALGKAALVDNSAGLVRLARREHRVGGHYADLVRDAAAHDAGAPADLNGADLEAYLDRIGAAGAPRFTELASAVRRAGDADTLLGAARALHQWQKDMTR